MINLTPDEIVIIKRDGTRTTIEPSGTVARLSVDYEVCGEVEGIPVVTETYRIEGLPDFEEGLDYDQEPVYLVSNSVLKHCSHRGDVFTPDMGSGVIRDEAGRVIGITRLLASPASDQG